MKICRTCIWAVWEKGPRGKIMKNRAGRCAFKVNDPVMPISVTEYAFYTPPSESSRVAIWHSSKDECPAWEGVGDE